jgi:hypothetical protein
VSKETGASLFLIVGTDVFASTLVASHFFTDCRLVGSNGKHLFLLMCCFKHTSFLLFIKPSARKMCSEINKNNEGNVDPGQSAGRPHTQGTSANLTQIKVRMGLRVH